jgi:hypothetical protein
MIKIKREMPLVTCDKGNKENKAGNKKNNKN